MSKATVQIVEKLETQLAQTIVYLGAIEALAEAYRNQENLRQDRFLFGTVYEGLWDAIIVRIGTMWDTTKGVASLPKLAAKLKRSQISAAVPVVAQIEGAKTSERARLMEWRKNVVAHTNLSLDAAEFDNNNGISIADVRAEAILIEKLIFMANECLNRPSTYYEALKEDALKNARESLARWKQDVA